MLPAWVGSVGSVGSAVEVACWLHRSESDQILASAQNHQPNISSYRFAGSIHDILFDPLSAHVLILQEPTLGYRQYAGPPLHCCPGAAPVLPCSSPRGRDPLVPGSIANTHPPAPDLQPWANGCLCFLEPETVLVGRSCCQVQRKEGLAGKQPGVACIAPNRPSCPLGLENHSNTARRPQLHGASNAADIYL